MGDTQKEEVFEPTTMQQPSASNGLRSSSSPQLRIISEDELVDPPASNPLADQVSINVILPSAEDPKPSTAQNSALTPNNNNLLASPTTSSNKAGGSGMGKSKSTQPNFDFDYNGPPVVVSNGMALELVNRFGLNNAWGAFLKLKGYHTPYDKNDPQPPEHVQALKRFRRKIRTVREMFNALRDKNEETAPLMSKEFVVLLKPNTDTDGANPEQQPPETPPAAPPTKEKRSRSKAAIAARKAEQAAALAIAAGASAAPSVSQPISVQIGESSGADPNALNNNGAVPADPTHPKRPRKSTKKEPKRDTAASITTPANTSTSQPSNNLPTNPNVDPATSSLNQSKIDEIVTNVIDRVMARSPLASTSHANKESPFHAQTSARNGSAGGRQSISQQFGHKPMPAEIQHQSLEQIPISSANFHHQTSSAALMSMSSVEQLQELYRQNPALFSSAFGNTGTQASAAMSLHSNLQGLLSTVKSTASLNPPPVTAPLTLQTDAGNPTPKFLLQPPPGSAAAHQSYGFLDPGTAQLFFPPPQPPQTPAALGNFGVPFLAGGNVSMTAALRAALQQHQQQQQQAHHHISGLAAGLQLPPQLATGGHWALGAALDAGLAAQLTSAAASTATARSSTSMSNPPPAFVVQMPRAEKSPLSVEVPPPQPEDVGEDRKIDVTATSSPLQPSTKPQASTKAGKEAKSAASKEAKTTTNKEAKNTANKEAKSERKDSLDAKESAPPAKSRKQSKASSSANMADASTSSANTITMTPTTKQEKPSSKNSAAAKDRKQSIDSTAKERRQSIGSTAEPIASTSNATPTAGPPPKKQQKEQDALIADLRDQVEQLESQLNGERTKFSVHKRRMDLLRDKLKKKDDELQTAKIDFACQKADNGALKLQIEALKAENEELRQQLKGGGDASEKTSRQIASVTVQQQPESSKKSTPNRTVATRRRQLAEPRANKPPPSVSEPTTSADPKTRAESPTPEKPSAPKKQQARKRPLKREPETDEEEPPATNAESEDKRRQSKRISAARSKNPYSAYS